MIAQAATLSRKSNRSVALVEDNADLRELMTFMLESYGFDVMVFEDGAKALNKLSVEGEPVYALLTDFEMPYLDGVSLIRELHKKQIKIPITVLISGSSNASYEVQALGDEIPVEFLEKPYLPEDLLTLLQGKE